jgi:hypothetical protein
MTEPTLPSPGPPAGARTDAGLDHLPLLARLQDEFLAGIDGADLRAPVPACGRWRARDLFIHLARIHHWAAGQARRQQETPLGRGPFDHGPFYAEQAVELRDTLAALGSDAESWTLTGTGPASFWHRRQLHETLVHLHDQRAAALGSATAVAQEHPIDVAPEVWADTVDEVVTMFQPRQVRLGRMEPLARTVRLVAADVDRSWVLGEHEDGRPAGETPAATVNASARELGLVLWRRLTPEQAGVDVAGDPTALGDALGARMVP